MDEELLQRQAPQALEAEQSVLGSTLFLKKFLFLNFLIFKVNVRVKSSFYVHFRKSVFH